MVIVLLVAAHLILLGADPIMRMVGVCTVLLAAMKGLVYAEWAGPRQLTWSRYFIFGLLWFGMDPGTFVNKRAGLSWKGDLGWGLLMMVVGVVMAWVVW